MLAESVYQFIIFSASVSRKKMPPNLLGGYNWAENAEISKSDDCKTIRIFTDENSAEIMIGEKNEKATLKISDGRTYDLKVKKENNKLNIYETETPPGREGIVDDVMSELQARFEKDIFKKWEERWVEPSQFDLVVSEVPAKFQDKFLQKLTVLLPATKSKIAREFQFCIDKEGIPNEKKRWIKGSSEAVMLYMGSKVAKASRKSGFYEWEIKEDPRYYHPLEDPLCPLLGIAVFFTEPKKSFSYSIIAKTEDGEICAIDGFFPTDVS